MGVQSAVQRAGQPSVECVGSEVSCSGCCERAYFNFLFSEFLRTRIYPADYLASSSAILLDTTSEFSYQKQPAFRKQRSLCAGIYHLSFDAGHRKASKLFLPGQQP